MRVYGNKLAFFFKKYKAMDHVIYSFEKLEAWLKAKELVKNVYSVTQSFPKNEQFGLTQQIRRAAVSVASNIAEGSGRKSPKDKAHYSVMAFGSILEVINQLILANELEFIEEKIYQNTRKLAQETSYMINALYKQQISGSKKKS